MKACCWQGVENVQVKRVPDPEIINPRDAIIRITSTAICGSDLHLYGGKVPSMQKGDVLGHEFMGVVEEVGSGNRKLKKGDRVAVPFDIACGNCNYCQRDLWSLCDNSNPNAAALEELNGFSSSGLFGYSHLYGGYAGGQAEFVRVPFADVGPLKIESGIEDEKVLFLTDILPTGYQAAEQCGIRPGDVVAVWGAGPVGQFAVASAFLLKAERVIVIDRFDDRLNMARDLWGAETINYERDTDDLVETLKEMTGGRGPDHVIDAVGMEAHGTGVYDQLERGKQFTKLQLDRAVVLRQAIQACGKGGTVSLPGVYTGFIDKFPMGQAFAKGLTFKMGQTNTHKYMKPLLERIERGEIDPSRIITHRARLDDAPRLYDTFREKRDGCIKVVLKP
ncbi:MAG TPA: zinc-dependent alcohol dehydrogenase [Gemmatirosa sp.]|nr:zinc-dependent alcohol dehydrogenase [Gemmatirosa sp.]